VEHSRFDALTRALTASRSRRTLARLLGGLVLGGFPILPAAGAMARRKRRKKRGACPRGKKRCGGVCRQCCAVEDCGGTVSDDGMACTAGQCVCTIGGTQRCPANTKWAGDCGHCCNDSECPGLAACVIRFVGPPECFCGTGLTCDQVCMPQDCDGWCFQTCNTPGKPAAGAGCCSGNALTCQPAPEQGDPHKHRCLPI
jgi:hypothetical protein